MPPVTLSDVEQAFRASWSALTCDPADAGCWSPANPALGQCGPTALTLNDLFGGELLLAEVLLPDGSRDGFHYWNRLAGGVEIDLTREQFGPQHSVQPPLVVGRPAGPPRRASAQYLALRSEVLSRLRLDLLPAV